MNCFWCTKKVEDWKYYCVNGKRLCSIECMEQYKDMIRYDEVSKLGTSKAKN
jgi:hypothetical protein